MGGDKQMVSLRLIMLASLSASLTASSQMVFKSGSLPDCNRHLAPVYSVLTWKLGASETGPYTLASTISNSTVLTPSGAAITENDLSTHQYHHHTRIVNFSGITFLAFSSGKTNEQDGGQQVAICWSTNKGASWSPPVQVVPSMSAFVGTPNLSGSRICYPRNFSVSDGTNYLVSAVDDVLTSGGTVRGAALLACALNADGTIGPLFRISAATCNAVDGKSVPAYSATTTSSNLMSDSKVYGCWGGSSVGQTASEWIGFYSENGITYVEPNTLSADGGSVNLYRLWRSSTYISQSSSTNSGSTWGAIAITTIPNWPSETTGLRLSDGRFAILGNPQQGSGAQQRDPLFLALANPLSLLITNIYSVRQGISQTPTYPGIGKFGGASYVSAVQVGNYLYVGYSLQKENVGFSRVLIPGLADSNND